jgi:ABC-type multidrug transport system permease subunit
MENRINPNLLLLIGVIFSMIAIMIGCEMAFHDGQIFTLFVGFINLLIGILVGVFKNVFHLPDSGTAPPQIPQLPQLPQEPTIPKSDTMGA